jgi:UDPglucose--hexose-1-phosphate uridylyltransferase
VSKADQSHARRNPLTAEWILVSPHRLQRPWQGQVETQEAERLPEYDAGCYLCPGNSRANDEHNPDYQGAFVFDNDFPALTTDSDVVVSTDPLFASRPESGRCRVICYTERHDLRLATMSTDDLCAAIEAMITEFKELDRQDDIGYVQIFENRGAMMGCSNAHPHAQVWATQNPPTEVAKELMAQSDYLTEHGAPLLIDYLQAELEEGTRIIFESEYFVAMVPYWATWPYEALILPRRLVAAPDELHEDEIASLAVTLKTVLSSYDTLFSTSAPYSMGLHARPSDGASHPEWQFHIHIYPPLLRSATVRKHLVGFEMLGMPQRDLTPEVAAESLREVIQRHKQ